jgi:hypothetical protein
MPAKNGKRPLTREGEPSQKTKTGLEIPVPTRDEFFGLLDKAAKKKDRGAEPRSRSPRRKPSEPS